MATYYGIEQSTDSREPRTKVTRLGHGKRGLAAAVAFASKASHLTYADAAAARNFHHTLYSAYEMPTGWRPATLLQRTSEARRRSSRDYPRNAADMLAEAICRAGERVKARPATEAAHA